MSLIEFENYPSENTPFGEGNVNNNFNELNNNISGLNSIVADLVANKSIYDSGSNADGDYIRFTDGTMVCYGNKTGITYTTADYWNFADRTDDLSANFPISFISAPKAIFLASLRIDIFNIVPTGKTTSNFTFRVLQVKGPGSASVDLSFLAIGKWK